MLSYATPSKTPDVSTSQEATPEAQGGMGNQAYGDVLGFGPAVAEGTALDPVLRLEVGTHLRNHDNTVIGLSGVAFALHPTHHRRAAGLVTVTTLIAEGIRDDLEVLAETSPDEGGALRAQIVADAGDLVDGIMLLDAYRMLGEEIHRLQVLAMAPALVALFGAPILLLPSVEALNETLTKVAAARDAARAAATDLGEVFLQLAAQQGLQALIGLLMPTPVGFIGIPVVWGKILFDNWVDDTLGSDPKHLPAEIVSGADTFVDTLDLANSIATAGKKAGDLLLDEDLLATVGLTIDLLDAGIEGFEACTRLNAALKDLRTLTPAVEAARADLRAARASVAPAMAVIKEKIHVQLVAAARTLADAALLVNDTENELGGLF